jgi:hypothetical protein
MCFPRKPTITFNYEPEMRWRLIVKGKKVNWGSGKTDNRQAGGCSGGLTCGTCGGPTGRECSSVALLMTIRRLI